METLAFIGAGNMSRSLINGLIAAGYDADKIWAANPSFEKLESLKNHFSIHVTQDNKIAANHADVVILGVKPDVVKIISPEIASIVQQRQSFVISIATGISIATLQHMFGQGVAIIRCMPNTPAYVGCGASGLFANTSASEEQKNIAESIMRAVGVAVWLNHEAQIDTVTALSGSGPAYFFLMMEALQQAAIQRGLPQSTAELLTIQTALGAARMALESNVDIATLRKQVTSPGGTTEHAINILEQGHIRELFVCAIEAAEKRAKELSAK